MADQMRGDCLGIAGHPDVKTPFLDALAAEGVRYENAYSACPTCVPARATLYTGMSQEHTGRVGYEDLVPWDYPHTLAGELSKAGYYTQCVGKMHVHPLRNNLGFHDVRLHDGYLHAYRRPSTVSYTHLDVYKRQGCSIYVAKCLAKVAGRRKAENAGNLGWCKVGFGQ